MRPLIAVLFAAAIVLGETAITRADDLGNLQEAQAGRRVHDDLAARGELLPDSAPGYVLLAPIARRIGSIANPQLDAPINFVLIHESAPNAFAVPGGTVYVTDALFSFVRNADELAAVLCHETSHEIHHDARETDAKNAQAATIVNVVGAIARLNRTVIGLEGENLAYRLQTTGYSRDVERRADFKGAMTCAAAGYNPWGMVWLFRSFAKSDAGGILEPLADHPTNEQRISDLEDEFNSYPQIFARFSPDIGTAAQF